MPGLRELEERFFRALQRPHGTPVDLVLQALVEERAPLDGAARIDIYAHMYCSRIIGSLLEDFPAVARVVGADAFEVVAHEYLEAHPSAHASLRHAGAELPAFLRALAPERVPTFVPDLARLEWAQLEVFDAPTVSLLTLDELRALPAAEWAALRLRLAPAVRLVDAAWPVHRCIDEETPATVLAPAPTCLRVWRRDFGVFVSAVDELEARGLRALQPGVSFGAVCEVLAAVHDAETIADAAAGLLVRWVEDAILVQQE